METLNLILSVVAILGVAIIALLWKTYLPSYLKKKAEQLATKEDIGEITEQVKKVETKYSSELEKLRSDLERKTHVSTSQFTLEFETYQEIWKSLVEVRRDLKDLALTFGAAEKSSVCKKLQEDFNSLHKLAEQKRPFYPKEIWEELIKLLRDFDDVGFEMRLPDNSKSHEELSAKGKARFEKVSNATESVCEAIRSRLSSLVAN